MSSSSKRAVRWIVGAVLFAALVGCDSSTSPEALGTLTGSVTLLGSAPVPNSGVFSLYESLSEYDARHSAYEGPLTPTLALPRTYEFHLENIRATTYYITACFSFGCGEYRDAVTGDLIAVKVAPRTTTRLEIKF
jgi:hypothetical protein